MSSVNSVQPKGTLSAAGILVILGFHHLLLVALYCFPWIAQNQVRRCQSSSGVGQVQLKIILGTKGGSSGTLVQFLCRLRSNSCSDQILVYKLEPTHRLLDSVSSYKILWTIQGRFVLETAVTECDGAEFIAD